MNKNIEETIQKIQLFGLDADIKMDDGRVRHFHHGHEYVEIGGIKWAAMNVGAKSMYDRGLYFQWGDTEGWSVEQFLKGEKRFNWDDYKWTNDGGSTMTKYNATDGKTVLEVSDDAVTAAWGGGWRMPTTAEFQALGNAVNTVLTTDYQGSGVNGLVCTDKTDPSKVLFFLAASYYDGGIGNYWSSSLNSCIVSVAKGLCFNNYYVAWDDFNGRCFGCPVRGVVG